MKESCSEYAHTSQQGVVGYRFDKLQISTGLEVRNDEVEQPDGIRTKRTTWLFKNNLKLQLTDDWRLLGKYNHSMSNSSEGDALEIVVPAEVTTGNPASLVIEWGNAR